MTESRVVGCLGGEVTERERYQPLIILVLDRHIVRAASIAREIVLIAPKATRHVCDAMRVGRKLIRIQRKRRFRRVVRMADIHSESKCRQHSVKIDDESTVVTKLEYT